VATRSLILRTSIFLTIVNVKSKNYIRARSSFLMKFSKKVILNKSEMSWRVKVKSILNFCAIWFRLLVQNLKIFLLMAQISKSYHEINFKFNSARKHFSLKLYSIVYWNEKITFKKDNHLSSFRTCHACWLTLHLCVPISLVNMILN
jgi:hypothetical protein